MTDQIKTLLGYTLALTKIPYYKDFLEHVFFFNMPTEIYRQNERLIWLGEFNGDMSADKDASVITIHLPSCIKYSQFLGVELIDVVTHVALHYMFVYRKHMQSKKADIYKADQFAKKYMNKIGLRPILFIPTNALESSFILQALMQYRHWDIDKIIERWYNKRGEKYGLSDQ